MIIDEYTDVEMEAPRIEIKSGFHVKAGARVSIKSSASDPSAAPCFTFVNDEFETENSSDKQGFAEESEKISGPAVELTSLKVFPNPSNGYFTIQIPEYLLGGRLTIVDLSGRLIHEQLADQVMLNLQMEHLPQVSFINVTFNEHSQSTKILKL